MNIHQLIKLSRRIPNQLRKLKKMKEKLPIDQQNKLLPHQQVLERKQREIRNVAANLTELKDIFNGQKSVFHSS